MKKTLPIFLSSILLPVFAQAATLRFDPPLRASVPGDVFVSTLRIDVSPGECINAVSVGIAYPADLFSLETVSRGESIFSLWLDQVIDKSAGQIHFIGGIPGGYCGKAVGDPGQSNIVAKVIFQYKGNQASSPATIAMLPDTEVDLNDGHGGRAALTTLPMTVTYAATSTSRNEWIGVVNDDTFPPEEFVPEIIKDVNNPKSPYYLVFDTTDKQSGVEHYEVLEEDPNSFGFRLGSRIKAKPAPATSPYLLQDQTLSSRIVVRAYDNAGNMQEEIIPPKNYRSLLDTFSFSDYILPLILLIVSSIAVFMSFKHYHHRDDALHDREDEESDMP